MAEKNGNGEKKAKKKSNRKFKRGAERITEWSLRASNGIKKLAERCDRWSKKADGSAKERLITLAHLFNESDKLLETVVAKSAQLHESGWEPPKFVQNNSFSFNKGDAVNIKEEYVKFYSLADKNALSNMKVGDELITGKRRVSYFVPGVGLIPKAHLEPNVSE